MSINSLAKTTKERAFWVLQAFLVPVFWPMPLFVLFLGITLKTLQVYFVFVSIAALLPVFLGKEYFTNPDGECEG